MHTTTTTEPNTSQDTDDEGSGLYGWSVDGEPRTGRLARYAQDRALSFYAGLPIGPLDLLTVEGDGVMHLTLAEVRHRSSTSDDWLRVRLQVGTDTATYRIDLRA